MTKVCEYMDGWWSCESSKKKEGYMELCGYYPFWENCPHFKPKKLNTNDR